MKSTDINNWLKESIQKAELIKKAQIEATRSRCLQEISKNVKKGLRQMQDETQEEEVDEIFGNEQQEQLDVSIEQDEQEDMIGQYEESDFGEDRYGEVDEDQELDLSIDEDEDEQLDIDLDEDEQLDIDLDEDEQLDLSIDEDQDQELDLDEDEQLDLDLDEDQELDLSIDEDEQLDISIDEDQDQDVQLKEYIRSVLESNNDEDQELDECDKKIDEEDQELYQKLKLKKENKELRRKLLKVSSSFDKVNKSLQETALLNLKTKLIFKIFESSNLNRKQKIKVFNQFDKATNIKEAKLIYSSLKQTLSNLTNKSIYRRRMNIPNVIKSTKPRTRMNQNAPSQQVSKLRKLFKSRLQD